MWTGCRDKQMLHMHQRTLLCRQHADVLLLTEYQHPGGAAVVTSILCREQGHNIRYETAAGGCKLHAVAAYSSAAHTLTVSSQ